MNESKQIRGAIVADISPVYQLVHGKIKREIAFDWGRQKYLVDDIVASVEDFIPLEIGQAYDIVVYINGLVKSGQRMTRLTLKKINVCEGKEVSNG